MIERQLLETILRVYKFYCMQFQHTWLILSGHVCILTASIYVDFCKYTHMMPYLSMLCDCIGLKDMVLP